ncbi:MAG: XRE family transcriptional regulator [Flavobacterium sp.]|nr:MAG: XRE family transcriptional regulator [Flavobacterium sp.]
MKIKNDEVIKALGRRVRELRTSQNLSQEQLANEADVPLSQIGRIERGEVNITISSIYAIANALGKTLIEFFNY